jgi:hypothetical protein
MINFSFRLPNFYGTSGTRATGALKWFSLHKHGSLGKNRSWEIQTGYWGWGQLLGLDLELDWKGTDHAGPRLAFWILGFQIELSAPSNRHWDNDANNWTDVNYSSEHWEEDRLMEAYKLVEADQSRIAANLKKDIIDTGVVLHPQEDNEQ